MNNLITSFKKFFLGNQENNDSTEDANVILWKDENGEKKPILRLPKEKTTIFQTGYSGNISFGKDTECEVENATFIFNFGHPKYLSEEERPPKPWDAMVNSIEWIDGKVISGKLHCNSWKNGEFYGTSLFVTKEFSDGKFIGLEMKANLIENATVFSGDVICNCWMKGIFGGAKFKGNWTCGIFANGEFHGIWNEGIFEGGKFFGEWHGGTWKKGEFHGNSLVGDGTFNSIIRL